MKKLALISACVLGLVFAGSAVNLTTKTDPVKTETKKEMKKEPVKAEAKKDAVKPEAKAKAAPKKGMKVEKKEEAKNK
jgi:hypothetical protein